MRIAVNTPEVTSMKRQHLLLGCIADDFTGATDLANNLVRAGMRVIQTIGLPGQDLAPGIDAVVIALKSRTLPVDEAVSQSLAALRWLQSQDCEQVYFKYCSTFDSTPTGNIGPVTEALMDALGEGFTIATPAFPDSGRTVFKGHLFVGDVLLQDSGMRHHPLTPMTDSNLVRVLQAQCARPVGLIDHRVMAAGSEAIAERIASLKQAGVGIAVVDVTSNADLLVLGRALAGLKLVTAASGVAIGLPQNFGIQPSPDAGKLPPKTGRCAIVSGSCSTATQRQVAAFIAQGGAAMAVDPLRIASGIDVAAEVLAWAAPCLARGPVLVYATASPEEVSRTQQTLGAGEVGVQIEQTLATIAHGLVALGVRQLVIAGGETSGACVQALGIHGLLIGPQIDVGVPWCHARSDETQGGGPGLHIALKSGNFGADNFFTHAFESLV